MNIHYIRSGDYYIPDLTLPKEIRPIADGDECTGNT